MSEIQEESTESSHNMVYITPEAVYMHMALFEEHKDDNFDPVMKILKNISHKHNTKSLSNDSLSLSLPLSGVSLTNENTYSSKGVRIAV